MTDFQSEKIQEQGFEIENQRVSIDRLKDELVKEKLKVSRLIDAADLNLTQHKEMMEYMKEIKDIIKPIAITYTTANTLLKWMMALIVLISIIIGIIVGWMQIFKK